jgi:uncharacterized membrane protein
MLISAIAILVLCLVPDLVIEPARAAAQTLFGG